MQYAVGRTVVDHDELAVFRQLVKHRAKTFIEVAGAIVRRHDDRERRFRQNNLFRDTARTADKWQPLCPTMFQPAE